MSEPKLVRPPQVTVAGLLVMGGSVVVVLIALGQGALLHSLDTRAAVEKYLDQPFGDQLGLGVQGTLTLLRVVWTVAAVSAAAAAVLGWYAMQRSKGARVALSWLAVPLFVASFFFIGVSGASAFPAMVTAAVVMLWFQPARDWYDGITPPAPEPPPLPAPLPRSPTAPTGRDPLLDLPPPTAPPLYATPYAQEQRRDANPEMRPRAATWACVLTWLGSATTVVLMAALVISVLHDPGILTDGLREQPDLVDSGVTDAVLRQFLYAIAGAVTIWSVAAMALALLVWRRVRWAAIGLAVSAGTACLVCLVALIGSLQFVVLLGVCAGTLALLLRPESRAWLRR
jgi:hypothetical protein